MAVILINPDSVYTCEDGSEIGPLQMTAAAVQAAIEAEVTMQRIVGMQEVDEAMVAAQACLDTFRDMLRSCGLEA